MGVGFLISWVLCIRHADKIWKQRILEVCPSFGATNGLCVRFNSPSELAYDRMHLDPNDDGCCQIAIGVENENNNGAMG